MVFENIIKENNDTNNENNVSLESLDINDININSDKSKLINILNDDMSLNSLSDKTNYSKMKVDELRALVVTKNLVDNESSQKMKKNELIKMIQEQ